MTFAKWFEVDGHFDCEDDSQKMMGVACEFHGFDLRAFDIWASALPECGLKTEMAERRQLAWEALSSNQHDAAKRHLEWMLLRRQMDSREQFLLPKARRDEARQVGTRKERRPKITEWIEHMLSRNPAAKSPELWSERPDWLEDEIGYERFSKRVTKARKEIKGRK